MFRGGRLLSVSRYAGAVGNPGCCGGRSAARRSSSSWGLLGSPNRPNPPPRSSHTVTRVGTGQIAVFGGEDEPRHAFDPRVYIFDGDTWTTRCSDASAAPTLLLGHGAASVAGTLYVFGGRTGGANCADDPTGQICETETGMLLALDTCPAAGSTGWEVLQIKGGPEARSFHAMTSLEDKIYVFGGCGVGGRLNDLWCLDTGAETGPSWHCLSLGGSMEGMYPSPRGGAGLVAVPEGDGAHRLILLYGFDGQQRGDVWTFHVDDTAGMWEDITNEQCGDVPEDRSVFAATRISENKIFIFGGEVEASTDGHEGAGAFRSDSYVLDTDEMRWRNLDTGSVQNGTCENPQLHTAPRVAIPSVPNTPRLLRIDWTAMYRY